jgi:hypothetical protein
MKAYWWSWGIAPLIRNFDTEWGLMVTLTSRPLYPWIMSPYKPIEKVGGLQCQSGRFREGKIIFCPCRYLTPDCSGHKHIFCEMSLGMAAAHPVTAIVIVAFLLTVISVQLSRCAGDRQNATSAAKTLTLLCHCVQPDAIRRMIWSSRNTNWCILKGH